MQSYSLATTLGQQQPGARATMSVYNTGTTASPFMLSADLISGVSADANASVTLTAIEGGIFTAPALFSGVIITDRKSTRLNSSH